MRRGFSSVAVTSLFGMAFLVAAPATAHFKKCPKDAVLVGTLCMDTYEAGAWQVPDPTGNNKGLVKKIQKGAVKNAAELVSNGATLLGQGGDDFAPCGDRGEGCADVFAVSLPDVIPSAYVTWFQAQQACANSGKRLPTSAEWQMAVIGTPDPVTDNTTTDCNVQTLNEAVPTGSRASCVSNAGIYDMVGNLHEWVADWVQRSTGIPGWDSIGSNDYNSFAGASTTSIPAALLRGGHFNNNINDAGPLTIDAGVTPLGSSFRHGFRCMR